MPRSIAEIIAAAKDDPSSLTEDEISQLRELHKNQPALRRETTAQVMDIFGVSEISIRRWQKLGLPHSERGGQLFFSAGEISAWLKEHPNLNQGPGRPKSKEGSKLAAVRLRKESALASKFEIELAQLTGELVFVRDVEEAAASVAGIVRNRLMQLPAAVSPQLVGLDAENIETILEGRIVEILRALAEPELAAEPAPETLRPAEEIEAERVGEPVPDPDAAVG